MNADMYRESDLAVGPGGGPRSETARNLSGIIENKVNNLEKHFAIIGEKVEELTRTILPILHAPDQPGPALESVSDPDQGAVAGRLDDLLIYAARTINDLDAVIRRVEL